MPATTAKATQETKTRKYMVKCQACGKWSVSTFKAYGYWTLCLQCLSAFDAIENDHIHLAELTESDSF